MPKYFIHIDKTVEVEAGSEDEALEYIDAMGTDHLPQPYFNIFIEEVSGA